MSQWLDKIRSSDNSTKIRYLILFSGLAGIVAVSIWAVSLRSTLEELNNPPTATEEKKSLMDNIKSAWNGIKVRTENTVEFFKEKFSETKEITIER